ncbi:hypothetical protein KM043_001525 [Ampulex compressa]|nr:hypothetical protein KM043_001525 [Ampulex compressa]
MEEAKQAWISLMSPVRPSTLRPGALGVADGDGEGAGLCSTTIWYDVPRPTIVHCRKFEGDMETGARAAAAAGAAAAEAVAEDKETRAGTDSAARQPVAPEYGEDARRRDDLEAGARASESGAEARAKIRSDSAGIPAAPATAPTRRSNAIALSAVTSVREGLDGAAIVDIKFLRTNRPAEEAGSDATLVGASQRTRAEEDREEDREEEEEQREEEARSRGVHLDNDEGGEVDVEGSTSRHRQGSCSRGGDGGRDASPKEAVEGRATAPRGRTARRKGSSSSLRGTAKRACEASDSDGYDPGIASMSGSYSDPECPRRNEEEGPAEAGRYAARQRARKGRLRKTWGRMRSWLREERTRINEAMLRQARTQAVGALGREPRAGQGPPANSLNGKRGFYDLLKAQTRSLGSITRIEEFGPSFAAEEGRGRDGIVRSDSEGNAGEPEARAEPRPVVGTTEAGAELAANGGSDSRGNPSGSRPLPAEREERGCPPLSCSGEKPASDAEQERGFEANGGPRDRAGKAGSIKRRMLGSIRGLMASTHLLQAHEDEEQAGQGGFEDVRRYVKQGGDFCKELAAILHERAELEATYAKGLGKLSGKLIKACAKDQGGNSGGGVSEAWRCVGEEMEAAAEAHRVWGIALSEQLAKPLRVGVAEAQGRSRKSIESSVDKASKSLQEWRAVASKSKKQSFSCARENERLQDLARLQSISQSQQGANKSSNHHMTEKEASKLEARRRKADDSSRRADTEFYTVSVRAERARLEYESTIRKGAKQMELLEEERLSALKDLANVYLAHLQALAPRLQQCADRLATPVRSCNVSQDVEILKNLIRRLESCDASSSVEQLLPDFYAEHVTLAMNRDRRKQALVRVLHLIRQDLERERRGREGLETLHRAFTETPAFAADESTQNVTEKLHHMRSMLMYLEAAKYKVGGTLAEVEGSKRTKHPLAEHILVSRDKQGLQQSVLKIPSWAKNESFEIQDGQEDIEVCLTKEHDAESRHWADRTAGDGNSENPPEEDDFSDFDEFSSHSEDNNNQEVDAGPISEMSMKHDRTEQCRAIYQYSANLNDELSLSPGDLITVHRKQADGWWIGECRGRTGIFPATYVQVIH